MGKCYYVGLYVDAKLGYTSVGRKTLSSFELPFVMIKYSKVVGLG